MIATWLHILFGSVSLAAGAAALSARKGSPIHARAGTLFFAAMLGMGASGAAIAASIPERGTAVIGLFTCYLVVTSWGAATRRGQAPGGFESAGLAAAVVLAATITLFAWMAGQSPNGRLDSLPAAAHAPFVLLAWLAAALDLNFIARGHRHPKSRIARHLWRMSTAFLIAAFSFFIGQQDEMPSAMRGSPLLFVPEALIFGTMIYWIFRMRFGRGLKAGTKPRAAKAATPAVPA